LGSKSTPPTLDNDGNALIEGALYWNSVDNAMYAWTGSEWGSISSTADIFRFRYTAAGGETSESGLDDNGVTLSYLPGKEQVYLNGVLLVRSTDYVATNGTSISSLAALTTGDILEIITFTAFDLATSISNTLFDAKGDILVATAADTPGKLTVGTNGQVLNADSSTATGLAWVTPAAGYSAPTLGSTSIASGATVTTVAGLTLTSPVLTTPTISTVDAKGDLLAGTADNTVARLAVGANNTVLVADSTAATGLKWATPPGGAWSQVATGSLTGTSVSITGLSGKEFFVILENWSHNDTGANKSLNCRLNNDSGNNYYAGEDITGSSSLSLTSNGIGAANTYDNSFFVYLTDTASQFKPVISPGSQSPRGGNYLSSSTITSIQISPGFVAAAFDAGTYYVWAFN
jgi:hypothetical protein